MSISKMIMKLQFMCSVSITLLVYYASWETPTTASPTTVNSSDNEFLDRCLDLIVYPSNRTIINLDNSHIVNIFKKVVNNQLHQLMENLNSSWKNQLGLNNLSWQGQLDRSNSSWKGQLDHSNSSWKDERFNHLHFRTLVNVETYINELFERCWPKWAGPKPSKRNWDVFLLNIEDEEIFNLKKFLVKINLSEKKFIYWIERFISFRNERVHEHKLNKGEKEEAMAVFEEQPEEYYRPLQAILFGAVLSNSTGNSSDATMKQIEDKVITTTETQREIYRILKIVDFQSGEDKLREAFDKIHERRKGENLADNQLPVAVAKLNNDGFAMFPNFKAALFAMSTTKSPFSESECSSMTIISTEKSLHPTKWFHTYVKFTGELEIIRKIISNVLDTIPEDDVKPDDMISFPSSSENTESSSPCTPKKRKGSFLSTSKKLISSFPTSSEKPESKPVVVVLAKFNKGGPVLQFYSECISELKKQRDGQHNLPTIELMASDPKKIINFETFSLQV